MDMTLTDAAKATKRTKQALAQAVQKGKLSAKKDANGVWQVDSAELFRVYPPEGKALLQDPANDLELLRARLATLEAVHEADRELIDELRRARDSWQAQAERLALTASPQPAAPPATTPQSTPSNRPVEASEEENRATGHAEAKKERKKSLFGWIFGRG